jgi:molybdopterin-binding protein
MKSGKILNRLSIRRCEVRLSARNVLQGKVIFVKTGAVNSEVILELPGGAQVVSIITNESVENLGLAVGKPAYAVIKASNVMIAVD